MVCKTTHHTVHRPFVISLPLFLSLACAFRVRAALPFALSLRAGEGVGGYIPSAPVISAGKKGGCLSPTLLRLVLRCVERKVWEWMDTRVPVPQSRRGGGGNAGAEEEGCLRTDTYGVGCWVGDVESCVLNAEVVCPVCVRRMGAVLVRVTHHRMRM